MLRLLVHIVCLITVMLGSVAGAQNPEISKLPLIRYVDAFQEAYYDLSYRAEGGALSTWLTLEYADGIVIDVNIYEFIEQPSPELDSYTEMEQGYVGIGGRIFPRTLTPKTARRLWVARQSAIQVMEQSNTEFMLNSTEVVFVALLMTVSGVRAGELPVQTNVRSNYLTKRAQLRSQQARQLAPAAAEMASNSTMQVAEIIHLPRNAPELGGFRAGIGVEEIVALNRQSGGVMTVTGHPSSALAAAAREQGFWRKVAAIVREIAGRHMFNDANKRTAEAVVNELRRRNQVVTGVEGAELRKVLLRVARGELRTIDEISRALRGH